MMQALFPLLPLVLVPAARPAPPVQTVDVAFTTRTSAPRDLYVVRGYTLRMHGIADHGVSTTFTVRLDGRTLALGAFSDEWTLDVPTKGIDRARGFLTVSYSRGRGAEIQMGRIEVEFADHSPFSLKDGGADGDHRRRLALANASRLSTLAVAWRTSDPAVRVYEAGADGLRVETTGASPGTYRVNAVVLTPGGVSFDADGMDVEVPELVAIRPECPATIGRDRVTEGQPFSIPLRLDAHDLRSVQVLRDGSPQLGELSPDKGSFLLARKDLREGEGKWWVRAVAEDGAVFTSRLRPLRVESDLAYLKHRVLVDCLAKRDSVIKAFSEGVGKAIEAHEAIQDAPSAVEAYRRWASLDAALGEATGTATLPNPLGLDDKQGGGWMAGVSAILKNWGGSLGTWADGMAEASSPISFDTDNEGLARQCRARTDALDRARRGFRDAGVNSESLALALTRLAQESGDPAPASARSLVDPARLRVLEAQNARQDRILGWLDRLYTTLGIAEKGSYRDLPQREREIARTLPPADIKDTEAGMATSAITAYVDMLDHTHALTLLYLESTAILDKYIKYPGPITAEDRERLVDLDRRIDSEKAVVRRDKVSAFNLLTSALARSGVPLTL